MKHSRATLRIRAAKGVCVALFLLTLSASSIAQPVYYVRAGATGNGSSWANAFGSIQQAINAAPANSEIRVAQGTYNERLSISRNIELKGGYAGTGPNPDARDIGQYQTIIDAQNTGTAITINHNASDRMLIEGFIVQNGRATPARQFEDAYGGGLYLYSGSPVIRYNWFRNNSALATGNLQGANGGAIFVYEGAPIIENNIFSFNSATSSYESSGGAVFIYNSADAQIRNNLFVGNSASASGRFPDASGGALWIYEGTGADIYNNTFVGNQAVRNNQQQGGSAIWAYVVNLDIRNNIFAGHQAASIFHYGDDGTTANIDYNCFFNNSVNAAGSGIVLGSNNIYQDPQFVDSGAGDFRLRASSPCRNAGDTSVVNWTTDLAGNPRVRENVVDIGAYEFQPAQPGDVDGNGCVNDQDLLQVLLNFGQTGNNPADVDGNGVVNDQDLLVVLLNFGQGC
ncbi:MAG: DUF1565 domain-containing protein [Fimbriimonadales bacterium]|nr:DUF1565 domain-containing protein [Fimbriimonadales bacterium]